MSFRLPQSLVGANGQDAAFDALQHEVAGEKAASLGRAGREVERRVAALAGSGATGEARARSVQHVADAVFAFVVQRELCGLNRHDEVLRDCGVTPEVMARVGARL